jgi:cell division protein FtsB
LASEIEKKIPFSQPQSQQTLSDEQVAEKVKRTGFDKFFAGLRRALNSPMGGLLQKFLSLTGIGAIATTVAWGALTIYDAFKAIKGEGSWMLLLIDIFALLSNGYLARFLQPLQNVVSGSLSKAVESLKGSEKIYNAVKKFLPKVVSKFANVNKLISQGDAWAKKKLKADMSKGKEAIQQAQTEIETLSQTETQNVTGNETTTGQTTNESFFYTQKKFIDYKSIYNKRYI